MHRTIEGVYRDGKVELREAAPPDAETARVLVTFLNPVDLKAIDLALRGIDPKHASELRARLSTFAEDWDRPDMDGYDAL